MRRCLTSSRVTRWDDWKEWRDASESRHGIAGWCVGKVRGHAAPIFVTRSVTSTVRITLRVMHHPRFNPPKPGPCTRPRTGLRAHTPQGITSVLPMTGVL